MATAARPDWPQPQDLELLDLPGIGVLRGAQDACDAVEATLLRWLPSYVEALRRANGLALGTLRIADHMPDDGTASGYGTPAMLISSTGLAAQPVKMAGNQRGTYAVHASFVARGGSWRETQRAVRGWCLLAHAIVDQHPSLDGQVSSARTAGEDHARGPAEAARTLGIGLMTFLVTIDGLVDTERHGELPDPDAHGAPNLPPTDPPTVVEGGVRITIDQEAP